MLTLVSSFNIDLTTALAELRGAKLVRGVTVHQVRAVEVFHDTIREAITSAMAVDVLVSWHRRLAAALEATGAIDLEALTDHLLGAGDRERASLYASRAATQAEKGLAFEKAARLFGVAAENCPDRERKRDLLRRWGDALVGAGRAPAAARAYVAAAEIALPEQRNELKALAGVQLLARRRAQKGMAMLTEPLAELGLQLPGSSEEATGQAFETWRQFRTRGFAFKERPESSIHTAELQPARSAVGRDARFAAARVGPPAADADSLPERRARGRRAAAHRARTRAVPRVRRRAVPARGQLATSGALDVAEAVARRLDQVDARAMIAYAKGMSVYHHGQIEPALAELFRAEDLLRNHCRGVAFEMRMSRMVISHLQITIYRDTDNALLREWLREAEDRGDRVSGALLRLATAMTLLR